MFALYASKYLNKLQIFLLFNIIQLLFFLQDDEYVGEIKGGLRPSMKLIVMGILHKRPKRFVSEALAFVSSLSHRALRMTLFIG